MVAMALAFLTSFLLGISLSAGSTYPTDWTGYREYCREDNFNVTCAPGHVILLESAHYGRMKPGRCITGNFGNTGCSVDVSAFLHSRCSGRRQCSVYVPDLNPLQTDCHREFAYYLLAKHTCVPVARATSAQCRMNKRLEINMASTGAGFISPSANPREVGSTRCPWVIRARRGQRVQLSSLVFDANGGGNSENRCATIGAVTDDGERTDVQLCRGSESIVYQSESDVISLAVITSSTQPPPTFLLKYRAIGCPTMEAPPGASVKIINSQAEVRCNQTGMTWRLSCSDNKWLGHVGNCTDESSSSGQTLVTDGTFPYGILLVVAIGVALGVFVGGLLLSLAAFYMKRKHRHYDDPRAVMAGPTSGHCPTHSIPNYQTDTGSPLMDKTSPGSHPPPGYTEEHSMTCPKRDMTYGRSCSQHGQATLKGGHLYESPHLT